MLENAIFITLVMFLQLGNSHVDAIAKAKELYEFHSLAEEFALSDYAMNVDVSVESTPESQVLFTSTGRYELIKEKDRQLAFVSWDVNKVDDSRQGNWKNARIVFVKGEKSLYLTRDKSHFFLGIDNKFRSVDKNDPRGPFYGIVDPFRWPIHSSESFKRMDGGVSGLAELLSNKVCFRATENDGTLESYWTVPSRSMGYLRLRSLDNLLLQYDLYLREKAGPLNEINVEYEGNKLMLSCKTTWARFGDVDVPREVRSTEFEEFAFGSIERHLRAKFEFFDPESDVYKKMLSRKTEYEIQLEKQGAETEKLSK